VKYVIALLVAATLLLLAVLVVPVADHRSIPSAQHQPTDKVADDAPPADSAAQQPPSMGKQADLASAMARAREQLLEDGDLPAAAEATIPYLPAASPGEIIALVQGQEFSDEDAPLLHLLARRFAEDAPSDAIAQLADAYFASNSDVEKGQLCLLVREISHPEGLDALVDLIQSPRAQNVPEFDPLLSSSAFALASSADPRFLDSLLVTAARSPSGLQTSLLDGLSGVTSPQALPVLLAIIDGGSPLATDPRFREIGVRLLGQIESESARDKLEQIKQSGEPEAVHWATEAANNLKQSAPGLYSAIGQ